MPKLYELVDKYIEFNNYVEEMLDSKEELTEEDLQMFIDTLDSIQDGIEQKVENIIKFLKNIEGDIEAYKKEKERLHRKQKSLENTYERVKEYTQLMLERANIQKLNAGLFKARLQKSPDSVEIVDAKVIPNDYMIPQDPKPDKKRILEDLKAGKEIPGVKLVTDKIHLRIS